MNRIQCEDCVKNESDVLTFKNKRYKVLAVVNKEC